MNKRQTNAFTLIELLVVIGIISVLIAILLPALAKARWAAKDVRCKSQLRQIAMGLTMYSQESRGYYPYAALGRPDPAAIAWNGSNGNFTTGGPGDYDFRPTFRRYLGTEVLNNVLRCPLATQYWYTNSLGNIDKTGYSGGMVKSPYAFYFGRDCFTVSGVRQDTKWQRSRSMMKAAENWSPASTDGSDLRFRILVSDVLYWNGYAGDWIVSTHSGPGRSAGDDNAFILYTGGGKYLPSPTQMGSANFAQTDGSVVSHKFTYNSIFQRSIVALRPGNQPSSSYYVPAELGR